jgi:hypothetical protein
VRRKLLLAGLALAIVGVSVACRPVSPPVSVRPATQTALDASRVSSLLSQAAVLEQAAAAGGVQVEATSDGYTPSSASDPQVRALEDRVAILSYSLETGLVRNDPEPRGDVQQGTYMAFLLRVSAEATPASIVVDMVTDKAVPWATKRDLERSSWGAWIGWNRFRRSQAIALDPRAALLDWSEDEPYVMRTVTARELARSLRSYAGPGSARVSPNEVYKCWVSVRRDSFGTPRIWAIWPWARDSSGVR